MHTLHILSIFYGLHFYALYWNTGIQSFLLVWLWNCDWEKKYATHRWMASFSKLSILTLKLAYRIPFEPIWIHISENLIWSAKWIGVPFFSLPLYYIDFEVYSKDFTLTVHINTTLFFFVFPKVNILNWYRHVTQCCWA